MRNLSLAIFLVAACVFASAKDIVMMTYNIKGHGMTDTRIAEVAQVINAASPDVVAVQEVDNRNMLLLRHNYLKDLAEATGMKYEFHPLVSTYYGIGLLCKETPISVTTKTFPFSDKSKDKEDRGVLIAEFKDYIYISTHYSLNANDRDTATEWLCNFARKSKKAVFIGGDFNAQPNYRAMVTFKNNGFKILNDADIPTYPAENPTSCIDMVICYNLYVDAMKFKVIDADIVNAGSLVLSDVSDHLPVFVRIRPDEASVENVHSGSFGVNVCGAMLSVTGTGSDTDVKIVNIAGSQVLCSTLSAGSKLDLSGLPHGIYVVSAIGERYSKSLKIVL